MRGEKNREEASFVIQESLSLNGQGIIIVYSPTSKATIFFPRPRLFGLSLLDIRCEVGREITQLIKSFCPAAELTEVTVNCLKKVRVAEIKLVIYEALPLQKG